MTEPRIIDAGVDFHDADLNGGLVIEHRQEIPQTFLDRLKEARNASTEGPMGNFHRFASIPAAVFEKWLREGYDATKEPAHKTVAKLRLENLDYFITTDKRL